MNDPIRFRRRGRQFWTCLALLGAVCPCAGASPLTPARVRVAGDVPAAALRAHALGSLARTQTVPLVLTLPLRDAAGLADLLRRLSDPRDAAYGHYLTPAQFDARFGPSQADYDALAAYARAQGLTVTGTHPDRLLLDVVGPAAVVETAFGTRLLRYQAPDGRLFYAPQAAPSVPRALAGRLAGVVGLSSAAVRRHPALHERPQAAPRATGTGPNGGLTPANIRAAYDLSGSTLNGAGQTLALFELDGFSAADITAYKNRFGLPDVPLQTILIDGVSAQAGENADEVTLDIEMQLALAPGVSKILVYEAGNSDTGILDAYDRIASDNIAQQISTSWGLDEQENDSAFMQGENASFQKMAAQGQTIFAAAGDHGAYDSGVMSDGLRVDDPASQPYVCGVGGTTLTNSGPGGTYMSETTWNSGIDGTGGGGVSTVWPLPSWQSGLNSGDGEVSGAMRNVPDVSLNADPETGYAIYYKSTWHVYGGVSCAAPLWAAFAALVNQQRAAAGQGPLGEANPPLYAIAQDGRYARDFHDVGDGSTNLFYHAVAGYDLATGLGTFNGAGLIADLVPSLTTAQPGGASFPAGLNFLSLPLDYSGLPVAGVFGPGVTLYAWSPVLLQYVLTPTAPANAVRLGQGYWVRFPSAVTVTASGTPAATTASFSIGLSAGWNMIGDPFPAAVGVGSVQVSSGGRTYSFADAVTAGLISGALYRYDTGTRAYVTLGSGDSLVPNAGCWIRASRAVTLLVPPP